MRHIQQNTDLTSLTKSMESIQSKSKFISNLAVHIQSTKHIGMLVVNVLVPVASILFWVFLHLLLLLFPSTVTSS